MKCNGALSHSKVLHPYSLISTNLFFVVTNTHICHFPIDYYNFADCWMKQFNSITPLPLQEKGAVKYQCAISYRPSGERLRANFKNIRHHLHVCM